MTPGRIHRRRHRRPSTSIALEPALTRMDLRVVLAHAPLTGAIPPVPALPATLGRRWRSIFAWAAAAPDAAADATEDAEEQECANGARHADDERLVVVNPGAGLA